MQPDCVRLDVVCPNRESAIAQIGRRYKRGIERVKIATALRLRAALDA